MGSGNLGEALEAATNRGSGSLGGNSLGSGSLGGDAQMTLGRSDDSDGTWWNLDDTQMNIRMTPRLGQHSDGTGNRLSLGLWHGLHRGQDNNAFGLELECVVAFRTTTVVPA